jgi:ATP-dependent DNA ligase
LRELKEKGSLPAFVNIVDTIKCQGMSLDRLFLMLKGPSHLKEYFDSIISKGGEGIMLREAGSQYKGGRSSSLRKFKPFFDTEVKILESNYPHGFECLQYD